MQELLPYLSNSFKIERQQLLLLCFLQTNVVSLLGNVSFKMREMGIAHTMLQTVTNVSIIID